MTAYHYRAITPSGAMVTGTLHAPNENAVIEHLRSLGQYPVSASPKAANGFTLARSVFAPRQRPSHRILSIATQELATLLQAGLDLDRALSIVERLGDLGPLQKSMVSVRTRVHGGASFADALATDGNFPKFFVSTVRAGELGGSLDLTLRRLSEYLARSVTVREAVASALLYPVILLVTAGLSIVFILAFVLPEFKPLFAEAGRALPWPTRVVMAVGDFVRTFWWLLLMLSGLGAVAFRHWIRDPAIRLKVDRQLLRLPVLGNLLSAIDIERFSRTLGTLISNGVPLPAALPLANDVIANRVLAMAIADSAQGLREGDGFADRLERAAVFPAVTVDLIRVGEESGKLDEMLLRQADLDEQRVRHSINRLLAVLVPGLTILLGLLVGGLIASLLSAILSVNDLALPQ